MASRWWGKTEQRLPTADSQRACASHSISSVSAVFASDNINPAHQAGGATVIAPLGQDERLTLWVWVTQWQGQVDQNVLALPVVLLPPSEPQPGWILGADKVRTLQPDLPLTLWASQSCLAAFHVLTEGTLHSRPGRPQPPLGQACLCSLGLACVTTCRWETRSSPPWRVEQGHQRQTKGIH